MDKLMNYDKARVIDVLNERLAFERSGVKLYDQILMKIRLSNDPAITRVLDQMQEHRNEEKEHEEWLEAQIRSLGGTAHEETEHSRLITRESQGIEDVIMNDPALPHLFHALLAAELVDNAGWDLLVQLADEAGDRTAKREFKKRLHEEEEHLVLMRRAVENFAAHEVLGEELEMPKSPTGAFLGT